MAQKIALSLNVFSSTPLSRQLYAGLLGEIETGRIRSGEKLPSIRDMSKQLQISTITVREAIDKLIELGVVTAKHGSGNYVTGAATALQSINDPGVGELQFTQATYQSADWELSDKFAWSSSTRHLNQAFNDTAFHPWWDVLVEYDFRVYQRGLDPADGLHWNKLIERYSPADSPPNEEPTSAQGLLSVRRYLSQWLNRTCDLITSPEDIFLVSGAQQARDLVAYILVKEGSAVVVEEPGSITDLLAYASKGAQLIHVLQDEQGVKIELLREVRHASIAHLITSANFPTGASLSRERAAEILAWAEATNVTLVEDSYGAGFVYQNEPLVSLLGLAASKGAGERVIYIGSLSQLLNPALRFAFIVVPKKFHNSLALASWLASAVPSNLSQHLVLNYFEQGCFEQDILRVTQAARLRRMALLAGLQLWQSDLIRFTPVIGGFHQAVWFNESVDDLRVFEQALINGIGVVPLSPYFHGDQYRSGISLSFAQMSESRIRDGLARLLPIIQECSNSQV